MTKQPYIIIEKKYVHKNKEENVLLEYLIRTLPLTIRASIVQNIILPQLSENDKNFFLQYYFPVKKGQEDDFYYISGIHGSIKKNMIPLLIGNRVFTADEIENLLQYYKYDEATQKYYLKPNLTIFEEMIILRNMKTREIPIADQNYREKLAHILEKIPNLEKRDIFISNMHVDLEHSFFFEHAIDHVPALMIIEAARQMVVACGHLYGNLDCDAEIHFVVSKIKVKFERYLELNFPIKMIGVAHRIKYEKNKTWKSLHFSVTFYQRDTKAAQIFFAGKSLDKNMYDYMRKDTFNYGYNIPRFKVHEKFLDHIIIRDTEHNEFMCRIVDISHKGFQLYTETELVNTNKSSIYEFYAFFQEVGMVSGKCALRWTKYYRNEAPYFAGFKITEIAKKDEKNLDTAIKKHCYAHEKRNHHPNQSAPEINNEINS